MSQSVGHSDAILTQMQCTLYLNQANNGVDADQAKSNVFFLIISEYTINPFFLFQRFLVYLYFYIADKGCFTPPGPMPCRYTYMPFANELSKSVETMDMARMMAMTVTGEQPFALWYSGVGVLSNWSSNSQEKCHLTERFCRRLQTDA